MPLGGSKKKNRAPDPFDVPSDLNRAEGGNGEFQFSRIDPVIVNPLDPSKISDNRPRGVGAALRGFGSGRKG